MKGLEEQKAEHQREKIDRLRNLKGDEIESLNQEGEAVKHKILNRFTKKKPPQGRLD